MTKKFIKRVLNNVFVDTTMYRYAYQPSCDRIVRIPIGYLGTTAVLDDTNWEVVREKCMTRS